MKTWEALSATEQQDLIDEGVIDALDSYLGWSEINEAIERFGNREVARVAYAFEQGNEKEAEGLLADLEHASREDAAGY